MRRIDSLQLTPDKYKALNEMQEILLSSFPVEEIIIFGSVARGEADDESDIDVLVLTSIPATHELRDKMSDVIFEINLKYSTTLSIVVIERNSWKHGPHTLLPLHHEVERDGVRL